VNALSDELVISLSTDSHTMESPMLVDEPLYLERVLSQIEGCRLVMLNGDRNAMLSGADSMRRKEMLASNANAGQPHVELVPEIRIPSGT